MRERREGKKKLMEERRERREGKKLMEERRERREGKKSMEERWEGVKMLWFEYQSAQVVRVRRRGKGGRWRRAERRRVGLL